ncbi:AraC family transcriptional regulator [Tamlana fucoidanivorans]|uniref:AraC family transcriptional regulator n=1 Tax=Allotamlana fucoidanivorans TaxID=2583814 RepID=A0A5C4SQW7_9FLAO|nr:AraC family transcriptional regulator [Tamlana fucoidanivorans]TNJ45846.1 AraC family transcriptional regulator [Tamlana fucoidanivorans]
MSRHYKKDTFKGQKMLVLHKKAIKKIKKNAIAKHLYVTDIGYFPKAQFHYRERKEGCLEYILIFCIDGSGWIEIKGKKYHLKNNQYFIIPKLEPHKYGANDLNPWSIYWLHFNGNHADHFVNPNNYPRELYTLENSKMSDRVKLFEDIFYTLEEGHFTNNIEYSNVLLTALLGSLKYFSLFRKSKLVKGKDPISKAIKYMRDNLNKKLDVETIASYSELSVSHFCLLFKKRTLHTPIEHFIFLKMQRACYLLDYSSLKVYEIAASVGYEDTYYFTRVFKKVMGVSPTSFRKKGVTENH